MNQLNRNISDESAKRELIAALCEVGHEHSFTDGHEIFAEGDQAVLLPIIISGQVKMIHFLEPGKEVIIGLFKQGDVFAIPPVIDGGKYPATAIAMGPTKLVLVERTEFLRVVNSSSKFSSELMTLMCGMMRDKTATIQNLATSSPEHRIGNVLLKLATGDAVNGPVRITLRREDIAKMAGLTTETTIRVIRRMAEKQLIKIQHGKIIVHDVESIKRHVSS